MKYKTLAASAVLLYACNASALTAGLTLAGTIVPGTCTISLDGNGKVDYSVMTKATVRAYPSSSPGGSVIYSAPDKTIKLTIDCDQPLDMSIGVFDNRSATLFPGDSSGVSFGLGNTGGYYVGRYQIGFDKLQIVETDGGPLVTPKGYLIANGGSTNWGTPVGQQATHFTNLNSLGFKHLIGDTTPGKVKNVSGDLTISAQFPESTINNAIGTITLDGSATFTLNYH